MAKARTLKGYGWHPSLPDFRDLIADTEGLKVAPEVDPRGDYMTKVYDQGQLGSCTANAIAAAIDAHRINDGDDPQYPSRLAIYWLERFLEGAPAQADTGAFGRDGLKAARTWGTVPEKLWPYSDKVSNVHFSSDPRNAGALSKKWVKLDHDYRAVQRSVGQFKAVLSNRQTVAFGFSVYESFESSEVASTGIVPMPERGESMLGGHEVLLVGYLKDMPKHALVRNSWSTDWALDGYFLMPWAYLLDSGLSSDFRTIRRPVA